MLACSYSSGVYSSHNSLGNNRELSHDALTVVELNRQKYLLCLVNTSHVSGLLF